MRTVTDPFPYPHYDYAPRLGPFLLGPNPEPENGVYCGDFFQYADRIPDNSIDLFFADPIYDQEADYLRLAQVAQRKLKSTGSLFCWSNGRWHYKNTRWLDTAGLHYMWTFTVINNNQSAPMDGKIICKANRIIWFSKSGKRNMREYIADGVLSIGGQYLIARASHLSWSKPDITTISMLKAFSDIGAVVVDPFCGHGVTAAACKIIQRKCLSFELSQNKVKIARQRIRDTQPPLFTLPPEQARLPEIA